MDQKISFLPLKLLISYIDLTIRQKNVITLLSQAAYLGGCVALFLELQEG